MVGGCSLDHIIHHDARHLHVLGIQRAVLHNVFHLGNDNAAGVLHGFGHRQGFQERGFLVHGEVAVFICICPADESDVDLFEGLVAKILFPVDFHELHQILVGDVIHLSTLQTWIHESVQADFCDYARTLCGNFPQQLSQRPDGQVPGLDLVFRNQFLQSRHQVPVAAHDAAKQSFMGQVVHPQFVCTVTHIGGEKQIQVFRGTGFQEPVLQCICQLLWMTHANETAHDDAVTVLDQQRCLFRRYDLAHITCWRTACP